jgi:hypothetical protein
MSANQFCVLQVPSNGDEAWRHAFAATASAGGWIYYEEWTGETITMDTQSGGLMLTWTENATSLPAEQWLVLTTPPDQALSIMCERFGITENEAYIHVSERYAMANDLVKQGSLLAGSDDEVITIPGLEPVARPVHADQPTAPNATAVDGPLAFYQNLPISETAEAWWPANMLSYPGSQVEETVDGVCVMLVGRRRLLTQGPHITLPAGQWILTVEITLEAPVAVALRIEWASTVLEPTLRASGKYEIKLVTDQADRFRSDLCIQLLVPVLHGELTIHGSRIERRT